MRNAILVAAALGAAGCSGQMQGSIEGSSSRPTISYQQGVSSDMLTVGMPTGEVFKGRVVPANQAIAVGYGAGWAGGAPISGSVISESMTGQMIGKLLSNRGRAMDCRFQYADSTGLTSAGGVGTCMIVGGERIDIVW